MYLKHGTQLVVDTRLALERSRRSLHNLIKTMLLFLNINVIIQSQQCPAHSFKHEQTAARHLTENCHTTPDMS